MPMDPTVPRLGGKSQGLLATLRQKMQRRRRGMDDSAVLSLGPIMTTAAVIIGAVVGLVLIAALLPTYLGAGADVVDAFNDVNTTTGDATADSLLPIFGLITAFAVLFAIVGLVFLSIALRRGGKGK